VKEKLVLEYELKVPNFKEAWKDGKALTALTDSLRPGVCPVEGMTVRNSLRAKKKSRTKKSQERILSNFFF
jgi:hypothetical protein